jgi:putative aldouronate transport system substrate-binding protein
MNVIAASGDAFDICFSADWQQYMPMVSRGAYAELDDLMAEYGKEYIAQMPSTVIEAAKYKGKMFAAPNLQGLATSSKIFVNSEIFDKYKLTASITKLDDLDPFMEAIKNGEPGMTPLYSYTGGDAAAFTYYLFNQSQGLFNINGAPVGCYDSSFKVVNQYTTDRAKEFYAWARKANQKGWISKSAATQKDDPNLMKSRKFAMQLGYSNPQYDANNWTNILPVTMKTIDIAGMDPVIQTSNCRSTMYSISAGSDSKEQAMMYINLINTDKVLYNTLCYGVEGKHYVLKDGFVELPEGLTAEKSGYNPGTNWSFGYTYNAYLAKGTDPSVGERQLAFDKAAKGEPAMGFVFDSTPIKTEVANCQSVIDEYAAALEMGVSDPEKTLATFVEKLNAAGAEKIIAEKQKQLDQWRVDNGK